MTKLHKSRWYDIGSDVNWIDYGGRWARHIEGTRYHVIRFDNLKECTGEQGAGYHCDLAEVDTESDQLDSALECCGLEEMADQPLNQVEALSGYGAAAPLWQGSSRNAHSLMREAKRESRRLQR